MLRLSLAQSLALAHVAHLAVPPLVVSGLLTVLTRFTTLVVPTWAKALASFVAIPTFYLGRARLRYWRNAHRAAQLGAQLPPPWEGTLPGNWDIVKLVDDAYTKGFLSDNLFEQFDVLGRTYDFYVLWGNHDFCTVDAGVIKQVLATDFGTWEKGETFDSYVRAVLGSGVFNSDGDLWKFHRSMTRPFFTRERISHFELFDRHADEMIAKMKARFAEGYAVDFQDLIARFTVDSATDFLFGSCVHALGSALPYPHHAPAAADAPLSEGDRFAEAFREAQVAVCQRARLVWLWPWFELFKDSTAEPMRVVDAYLNPIIEKAVRRVKNAPAKDMLGQNQVEEEDTLLDHLVKFTTDPTILHDEVLNIMVAGRDTTASVLTITIYFLSQHPEVLRRLREEIMTVVGPEKRPTYDDIRGMKYLRAVLNETLRLYPPVPWNMRFATKDTILPNYDPNGKPWYAPAGSSVSYSVHCMHRRKDYWGPDAEEFDPDRFIDDRLHKYLTPNPFIFLPFNAGPRICLGQQFAYNEMSFVLIRLLQHFSTVIFDAESLRPEDRPPTEWAQFPGRKGKEKFWPKAHLTVYSAGGMWVKMAPAVAET